MPWLAVSVDEERRDILGKVLAVKLRANNEYVRDASKIQEEVHQIHATVDDMGGRLRVFEHVLREHDSELTFLKQNMI